ncbi:MAG: [FeFe] hydrogenase, group A [Candidatus Falkowbacteria bacterium]|nr:[FeFe] hydrogenase, group A [Candidatus Falkowbacteria bacterium]
MTKKVNFKLNGKKVTCESGETILMAAENAGVLIPSLCHHPDLKVKANCRVCAVEVRGREKLVASCQASAVSGMEIFTDSPKATKSRQENLKLLFATHAEYCADCPRLFDCDLLRLAREYKIVANTFPERKMRRKIEIFGGGALEFNHQQCIDCNNCVDACADLQKINFFRSEGQGINKIIKATKKDSACISCGQCALRCPVSAIQENFSVTELNKALKNKKKIMIAQFAPSIRAAIGEEFGLPFDDKMPGRIASALKMLGFDYVFDVDLGADITTMTEAEELVEKLKDKKAVLPMTTSCCPAWVRYVEHYHPEIIPHLTSARSPHMHLGSLIKSWWAKEQKINPKRIEIVSVMPCTAKKFEIVRPEFRLKSGVMPVDRVITTREFAFMIKKAGIDFAALKPVAHDLCLNNGSGAGAIYGASGGVMEAALRSAKFLLDGQRSKKIAFKTVRGASGLKEAKVNIFGRTLRVAVVNGIGNIEPVIKNLSKYDYIEVMSCPGGCLGGGGQPIPTTAKERASRTAALYQLDDKLPMRSAHDNRPVLEYMEWAKTNKRAHELLHTKFKKRV